MAAALIFWGAATGGRTQSLPVGANASDFNSVEYYDAPHQQQIKSEISGAEADPLPGGLLLVKQARLERFGFDGKPQFIADAPECTYDPINGIASSPGKVHMQTGDENLRIDGIGFLWRQNESFLTISNQVQTVIEKAPALTP